MRKNFREEISLVFDQLERAAKEFGENSSHSFLKKAGINQATISSLKDRFDAGANIQGFSFNLFIKLQNEYKDLNIGAFFDINQPIKKSKGQGGVDNQVSSTIQKLQHRVELLEIDNKHLKDKLKLTEELLDACREKIKP